MADDAEGEQAAVVVDGNPPPLSKSARKKLLKQERQAARKAERKVADKERRRADLDRRRREWEEALAAAPSDEAREEMLAARRETRRERVGKRVDERGARAERLRRAAEGAGQKVVLDLEFADLMRPNELHSLTQQVGSPCPSRLFSLNFELTQLTLMVGVIRELIGDGAIISDLN